MSATDYGVNDALAVKLWSKALAREALKKTQIGDFIGQGEDSLIQEKTEMKKSAGDRVTIGLRMLLSGAGASEGQTLEGNEEALTTYSDNLTINELAHAVRSRSKIAQQRVHHSIRDEAKDALADWFADRMDTAFFNHICGYTVQTDLRYVGNNAVVAPDADHKIYGGSSETADEGLTTAATDIFTLSLLDQAVKKAKLLSPMIRPFNIKGRKKYVMFLHPAQVYDLRASAATAGSWADIQKAAIQGGDLSENPIYSGALGEFNGVILHESSRVTPGVHSSTGLAVANTRRAVLCGAQSAAIAFGKGQGFEQWDWVEDQFDYERELGVSAQTIFGLKKLRFNSDDFSTIVVSTYAAD